MKNNIKKLRLNAKLTQVDLAKKLGYKTATIITMWESGDRKPPLQKIHKLAEVLNVDIATIVNEFSSNDERKR